jgi:LacI family transcriptional regulator
MPSKSPARQVALIYDAKLPYDVKVMSGVAAYLQKKTDPWSIYIEEFALDRQRLPELGSWHGDGVIADFDDPRVAAEIQATRIPTVAFGSGYGWHDPASGIPYFYSDQRAVAQLVADHLLDRGFHEFAYYGYCQGHITGFSAERAAAFGRRVQAAGYRVRVHTGPYELHRKWSSLRRRLRVWLESLPKPVGLMAANDKAARQVLEVCRADGIRVPEDIAVVGVDNDEMLCRLSTPPLSSVEQGAERIGFQAATLLDRMMSGRSPRRRKYVIPPEGLVVRRSSDIIAIDDEDLVAALALIRDQACGGIKVHDVARAAAISRSQLDRRFKDVVGRTIHDEIRRVRLEQARRLLAETSLPLKQVAFRCGFRTVQHLTTLFRQCVGVAPGAYRRERLLG